MSTKKVHLNNSETKRNDATENQKTPQPTKKKCIEKFLTFIGLREDEDEDRITEEERQRRYEIAIRGWRKVKKVLNIIKAQGVQKLVGKNIDKEKKKLLSYENFLIMPNSKTKSIILTLKAFLMIYSFLIIPYRAFYGDFSEGWLISDYVIDPIFLLEVITNFFSAFNRRTKIYKKFSQIAHQYLLGNFAIDLLSIFPYYWVGNTYYSIRFVRFLQLFEAKKIIQNFLERTFLLATSDIKYIKSITGIINFAWLLLIIGQFLSCIWYYVGSLPPVVVAYDSETGEAEQPITGWIGTYFSGGSPSTATIYISSIYWVFTTLSTVGYGDIYGSLTDEYLYNMGVEFIGVFLFAYMMSNINSFIVQLEENNSEIMEKNNEELDQWIMKIDRANPPNKKLPNQMVSEIKDFFRTYWQKDHTMIITEDNFLHQLPRDLKAKLIQHLFGKFIQKFEVFFKGTEEAFGHEVVINLVPRRFQKNTDIIGVDQGSKNIYFITKGVVIIGSHDGVEKYVSLPEGSFFGDHLILFNLKSSNAFRTSVDQEVECMCLSREKFIELCEEFPESVKVMKYKAYLRRKFFRQAKLKVQAQGKIRKESASIIQTQATQGQINELNFLDELLNEEERSNTSEIKDSEEASPEETAKLLEKARKIKNALDKAENMLNNMEEEFSKKIKNIKYYIGFISNMEDLLNAPNQNQQFFVAINRY